MSWRLLAVLAAFAMIAAACGSDSTTETEATTAETEATTAETEATTAETEATEATTAPTEATEATEAPKDFGEPVTLNLGHPFGATHPIHANALTPMAEAVAEETGGVITIEFHAGGALAPTPATFENTVVGGQDLGWALQGYHAGVFPVTEVIEQPFQFTSAQQATSVMWDLYNEFPEFQAEYSDVKLLGLWVHDIGDFWTKDTQITTLEDVAGLNIRFPTRIMSRVLEKMGAAPVGMPAPQIFDSLSTGVIDGVVIAVSGLQSFQLYPEISYGVECNCYVATQYLVMNLDAWNALTPDAQEVLERLGREASFTAATVYDGAYERVSGIAVEEGVEKVVLSDEELARWQAIGAEVTAEWIAEQEAEGVPAQAMFDRMLELIAAYDG